MKTLIMLAMLGAAGCASPTIPDNIPPAPPVFKGERVTAPAVEEEAPPTDDGFGTSAFDDAKPTETTEPAVPPAEGVEGEPETDVGPDEVEPEADQESADP